MLCSVDPRIPELVDQISKEKDPQKLIALSRQLTGILDENIKAHRDEKDTKPLQRPSAKPRVVPKMHTRDEFNQLGLRQNQVLASWFGDPDVRLHERKQLVFKEGSARQQA